MPGPQSAVGRNPTALFHLRADFHRISMRVQRPTRHGGSHSPHRIRARILCLPSYFRFRIRSGVRRAAARIPSGLTRLACAKGVRYTQLSPTERSAKSVGSPPTSRMQKMECG
ncbi:hypothetical protein A8H40_14355 [Burkholderia multivorans]|nr:hypothetical protein A8H40_14355 [Burkholderia multivorans]